MLSTTSTTGKAIQALLTQLVSPSSYDRTVIESLVALVEGRLILHRAVYEDSLAEGDCREIVFHLGDLKAVAFFDCGDFDYIDHFIMPSGDKHEDWPVTTEFGPRSWDSLIYSINPSHGTTVCHAFQSAATAKRPQS